jgi:hypothetical protein
VLAGGGGLGTGRTTCGTVTGRETAGADMIGGLETCIGATGALPIPTAATMAIRSTAASFEVLRIRSGADSTLRLR